MKHLLQWNKRRLLSKWPEFKGEILRTTPVLAAIQETHFKDSDKLFRIPGYSWHTDNVNEQHRRGGAAILIDNSVPHNRIALNTPLNCVAVRLKIGHKQVSALSIYISPNATDPTPQELYDLIVQLPPPLLFMNDVNAVHPSWGGVRSRGVLFYGFGYPPRPAVHL